MEEIEVKFLNINLQEIEAKTWEEIDEAIKWLNLDPSEKKIFSAFQIYQLAGIDLLEYDEITFGRMVKKKA